MKNNIISVIVLVSCIILMSSCAELLETVSYLSSQSLQYMDNYDRSNYEQWKQSHPDAKDCDYKGYQFRRDGEMSGLITAMEAIHSGDGGKAMVGIKVAGNIIGSLGGLDMSIYNQVIDNSMNSMLADEHSNSNNRMNIIGSLIHGGEEVAYVIDDRLKRRKSQINTEEYYRRLELSSDPKSQYYDPYFDCRYELKTEGEAGKYGSTLETIQLKDINEALDCIRKKQKELAAQEFTSYMQKEYGINMSYDEYAALPASEKPSIEKYVFPTHKAAEEILNETIQSDEFLDV